MLIELHDILDGHEAKTIMLINSFWVYGVEDNDVWTARCIGIKRRSPGSYDVILYNAKQFYRPLKRTSFIFQLELAFYLRLTLARVVTFSKPSKVYLY